MTTETAKKDNGEKLSLKALGESSINAKNRYVKTGDMDEAFYCRNCRYPAFDPVPNVAVRLINIKKTTQKKQTLETTGKYKAELKRKVYEVAAILVKANDALKMELNRRKIILEQITQSLYEKDILIREVYHRVKNNLQVASSLLNLQSEYVRDEKSREVFRESQNRIRSMALIHERLSLSENHNKIEFYEYINSLCSDLFISYNINPDRITFKLDTTDIFLDIETANLCGLIINELISNTLKHAFPGNTKGEITIVLKSYDHKCLIIVRDNGIGFPANIDAKNTESLGLQLVYSLTKQLGGEIELDSREYTEFRITFPLKTHSSDCV